MLKLSSTTKTFATGLGAVALSLSGLALSTDNAQAATLTQSYTVSLTRAATDILVGPVDFTPSIPKFNSSLLQVDVSIGGTSYGSSTITNSTSTPPRFVTLTSAQITGTAGTYAIAPLYDASGNLVSNQVRARRTTNGGTSYQTEVILTLRTGTTANALLTNTAKYGSWLAKNTFTYDLSVGGLSVASFQTLINKTTPLLAPSLHIASLFPARDANNPAILNSINFAEDSAAGTKTATLLPGDPGFSEFVGTGPVDLAFSIISRTSTEGGSNNTSVYTSLASPTATITYTYAVPEPLTMLGAATAVGFGAAFKRRALKRSKKD